jgi:inorganic pyrophosphatase
VLALMDEPGVVGYLLQCRMVGIIEGEQGKKKDAEGNDRIVAIERDNHRFSDIRHVKDLGKEFARELQDFFVNYHQLTGEKYRILDVKGPGGATQRIQDGIRTFKKS